MADGGHASDESVPRPPNRSERPFFLRVRQAAAGEEAEEDPEEEKEQEEEEAAEPPERVVHGGTAGKTRTAPPGIAR